MTRAELLAEVSSRLGDRRLVWAGLRGDDIEPLADLDQLQASFSIVSRYARRESVEALAYEDLTGRRVDPEIWDIEDHLDDEATREFRQGLLRALASDSALLPYRPSGFLSAIWFARRDKAWNLGMFGAHQSAFEHKPWVETAISNLGVPHVPWYYIADEDQLTAKSLIRSGPVMLRRSRTSGGEGLERLDDPTDLAAHWPHVPEKFMSISPYLDGALPVNVGATVWKDGVTVHRPSVQLIGIPGIVTREFGYCGNDFGRMRDVEASIIDEIETTTVAIGDWLGKNGYRGTFGVDYLVHEGHALFSEVNPRFQGSTHLSSRISIEADEPCLMLEHIAAWLGLSAPDPTSLPRLRDVVASTGDIAHMVYHWTGGSPAKLDTRSLSMALRKAGGLGAELLPESDLTIDPGAAVARWTVRSRVTSSGYDLMENVAGLTGLLATTREERGMPRDVARQ